MRKLRFAVLVVLSVLMIFGCTEESSMTGSFGSETLTGQVMLTGELEGSDPEGIDVRVVGTGMVATTDENGRFLLVGVPSGMVTLQLSREDGLEATESVEASAGEILLPLSKRRGRGRGFTRPGRTVEGEVIAATDESILVDSLKEGEVELLIDDDTLIIKGAVKLIGSEIAAGELIRARVRDSDEGVVAQIVKVVPRHGGNRDHLPASVVGEVLSNEDGVLVVFSNKGEEVTVLTDDRTEVYYKNQYREVEDIEPGDRVKVFGFMTDQGLVASWIRIKPGEDDDDEGDDDELDGSIDGDVVAIGDGYIDVEDDGLVVRVNVSPTTEIKHKGRPIDFSEIQVGDEVTAIGDRIDEVTLDARKIIVHEHDDDDELDGSIDGDVVAIGDGYIEIEDDGLIVRVNVLPSTEIKYRGRTIDFSEIRVGDEVTAIGDRLDEVTLDAHKIIVHEHDDELDGSIDGDVVAIGDDYLEIEDDGLIVRVNVSPSTEIKRKGHSIDLSDVELGDEVTAIGDRVDEVTLDARKIIVHADDD